MSTYFTLGKAPESPEERASLLAKKVQMDEYFAGLQLTQVQQRFVEFLISGKGYSENDLEINQDFTVHLPECSFTVRADIIIKIQSKRIFIIKCVMGSMESWERHSVAFGRVADQYQMPYVIITSGEDARMLATADAAVVAEGLDAVPSRQEAERISGETVLKAYPSERAEKEKRILYAFEAVKCPNS